MKAKIISKKEKKLVERTECEVILEDFDATPSGAAIAEEVAKLLNKPKEAIVTKNVSQGFGSSEAKALVYVYDSAESLKKFEPKKKSKEGAAPKPAEAQ